MDMIFVEVIWDNEKDEIIGKGQSVHIMQLYTVVHDLN